jgi:hypothetical protein
MGATYVGVRRAHPYSWLLSSPQQPLETEDPPNRLSCPTIYIATTVPCKTLFIFEDKQVVFARKDEPEPRNTKSAGSEAGHHRVDFSLVVV